MVVDRLEGANEALRRAGIRLLSLVTLKDLVGGGAGG